MSQKHGHFLEPSREARILNRWRLLQSLPQYEMPETYVQALAPDPWFRDPIEPEDRRVFYTTLWEAFNVAQNHFLCNTFSIANKYARIVTRANHTTLDREKYYRRIDEYDAERSQESHDKEAEEAKFIHKIIDSNEVAGLDKVKGEGLRIKIWVFVTGDVSEELLASFLDTTPEALKGYASYGYIFPQRSPDSTTNSKKHQDKDNSDDLSSDSESEANETDNETSTSKSLPSFTPSKTTTLPSPFLNKRHNKILETWHDFIAPYSSIRSMYSMHMYIELDDQTVTDEDTVKVVTETNMKTISRRIDFAALKEEISLKAIESLTLDITQLPGDWTGVVRGPVSDEAKRMLEEIRADRLRRKKKVEESGGTWDEEALDALPEDEDEGKPGKDKKAWLRMGGPYSDSESSEDDEEAEEAEAEAEEEEGKKEETKVEEEKAETIV